MRHRFLSSLPQNIRASNIQNLIRYRTMAQAPPPKRPIKVLMLHGFTQSGPSFHAKTRALEKNLIKAFPSGISLHYPTAPHRLAPADIPFPLPSQNNESGDSTPEEVDAWAWWRRKDEGERYTYEGLDKGLEHIHEVMKKEGPFDGVIGFSQGGACAAMVASLLEEGRMDVFRKLEKEGGWSVPACFEGDGVHPPLKFAVSYSGFLPKGMDEYKAFYEPKIKTPMLHFLGTLDAVVEEARSLALAERCEVTEGRVVYHPGGHFLPSSQKAYVAALVGFMKEVLHKAEHGEKEEESVEDMDVPF